MNDIHEYKLSCMDYDSILVRWAKYYYLVSSKYAVL